MKCSKNFIFLLLIQFFRYSVQNHMVVEIGMELQYVLHFYFNSFDLKSFGILFHFYSLPAG